MAKNALGQEDLAKFKTIKQSLLRAVILSINLKQEGEIKEFVGQTLASKGADLDLKLKILLPSQDLRKVNFGTYYQRLNTESHDSVLSFIRQNIIADPQQITESWQLVDEGLS